MSILTFYVNPWTKILCISSPGDGQKLNFTVTIDGLKLDSTLVSVCLFLYISGLGQHQTSTQKSSGCKCYLFNPIYLEHSSNRGRFLGIAIHLASLGQGQTLNLISATHHHYHPLPVNFLEVPEGRLQKTSLYGL